MAEHNHETIPPTGFSPILFATGLLFNTRSFIAEKATQRHPRAQPANNQHGQENHTKQVSSGPHQQLLRGLRSIGTTLLNGIRSSMSDYDLVYSLNFVPTTGNSEFESLHDEAKGPSIRSTHDRDYGALVVAAAEEILSHALASYLPHTRDQKHTPSSLDLAEAVKTAETIVKDHAESSLPGALTSLLFVTPRGQEHTIQPYTAVGRVVEHLRTTGAIFDTPVEPLGN